MHTFRVKSLRRFISVIPRVDILKHSPERMWAVLFESKLMCDAFLEFALQCNASSKYGLRMPTTSRCAGNRVFDSPMYTVTSEYFLLLNKL